MTGYCVCKMIIVRLKYVESTGVVSPIHQLAKPRDPVRYVGSGGARMNISGKFLPSFVNRK